MTMTNIRLGIMIDVESMGLKPDALVWQVGMQSFNLDTGGFSSHIWAESYLPAQPLLDLGQEVDAGTILFWMEQDDDAQSLFAKSCVREEGIEVLKRRVNAMHQWVSTLIMMVAKAKYEGEYEIWSNHPQFDLIKMAKLFGLFGLDVPWHHRSENDLATLKNACGLLFSGCEPDVPTNEESIHVKHKAIDDCRYQIECWKICQDKLGNL